MVAWPVGLVSLRCARFCLRVPNETPAIAERGSVIFDAVARPFRWTTRSGFLHSLSQIVLRDHVGARALIRDQNLGAFVCACRRDPTSRANGAIRAASIRDGLREGHELRKA